MGSIKESKAALAGYYKRIASLAVQVLPEDWSHLALAMIRTKEEGSRFLVYVSRDGGAGWEDWQLALMKAHADLEPLYDAMDECEALRDYCAEMGDAWQRMTFLLKRGGEFSCDFDYAEAARMTAELRDAWKSKALHP